MYYSMRQKDDCLEEAALDSNNVDLTYSSTSTMPSYSFALSKEASSDGVIELNATYKLPVDATLNSLIFQTEGRCDSRSHTTTVSVKKAQGSIINLPSESVQDCQPYELPLHTIKLKKGDYDVLISSKGFESNEAVKLTGTLTYSIFNFFGTIEGISEIV
jgi:hypothetical protein